MSDLRVGLRLARGLVTAAVAAGIGVACHVGAGGLLPSVPWLIAVFAGVAAVTIALLGIPAGLLRLMALVGGSHVSLPIPSSRSSSDTWWRTT